MNRNIKKVIIHSGLHKTGTTSVQETVYKYRKILERNNICYPKIWAKNHGPVFYSLFNDNPYEYGTHLRNGRDRKSIDDFNNICKERLREAFKSCSCENILFSGEEISTIDKKNLERMKQFILSNAPEATIEIIVTSRSKISFINSWSQQMVKMGRPLHFSENSQITKKLYSDRIGNLLEVFGKNNLTVYSFEDACAYDGGIVMYFLEKILYVDKDISRKMKEERTNAGVSEIAFRLLNYINSREPLLTGKKITVGRKNGDTQCITSLQGVKYKLSKYQCDFIIYEALDDNKWLCDNFGIDYNDKYPLFNSDEDVYTLEMVNEIRKIRNDLSPLLKKLVIEFFEKERVRLTSESLRDNIYRAIKSLYDNNHKEIKGIKKIYLHVGMNTTATRNIQDTMANNRDILERNNITYPLSLGSNHGITLYSMFCEKPEKYSVNVKGGRNTKQLADDYNDANRENFVKEMKEINCENVVISAEGLAMLYKDGIINLKAFFKSIAPNAEIVILYATRDRISYVPSAIQQTMKLGIKVDYGKFERNYKNLYKARLGKYIDIFGKENIIAFKFEDAVDHEFGPVGYFFEIIGVNNQNIRSLDRSKVNEGVSDKALEIMEFINNINPLFDEKKNINFGRSNYDLKPIWGIRGNKFKLDENIANELLMNGKEDIEWLYNNTGIKYSAENLSVMEEPNIYDNDYYDDVISCLNDVSDYIKEQIRYFCKVKYDETKNSAFLDIVKYIDTTYYLTTNTAITFQHIK